MKHLPLLTFFALSTICLSEEQTRTQYRSELTAISEERKSWPKETNTYASNFLPLSYGQILNLDHVERAELVDNNIKIHLLSGNKIILRPRSKLLQGSHLFEAFSTILEKRERTTWKTPQEYFSKFHDLITRLSNEPEERELSMELSMAQDDFVYTCTWNALSGHYTVDSLEN